MRFQLQAVLFDLDGTLADSEPFHEISRNLFLEKLGIPLGEIPLAIGRSKDDFYALLKEQFHLEQAPRAMAMAEFDCLLTLCQAHELQTTAGTLQTLERLKAQGIPMAVVSSSLRNYVEGVLRLLKIDSYFSVVVTGDDVVQAKPDPQIYCLALQKLGVKAEHVVAVEDSHTGVTAALRAGIRCVGYQAEGVAVPQDLSIATKVISEMQDLYDTLQTL